MFPQHSTWLLPALVTAVVVEKEVVAEVEIS